MYIVTSSEQLLSDRSRSCLEHAEHCSLDRFVLILLFLQYKDTMHKGAEKLKENLWSKKKKFE